MIWTITALIAIGLLWKWMESRSDRKMFVSEGGRVCANLNAAQANDWLRNHPETQVLDVRSAGEFKGGALPGAVNISIGDPDFDEKVSALDKSKPVLVYCAGGMRSRTAVSRLKQMNFTNIQHIHRGYMSWQPDARGNL